MCASQQPMAPHEQRGPSMLSGMCANSPAMLCAPAQQLAVDDDADADAVRDADEHQIPHRRGDVARLPHLRQRARAARVLDVHRKPGRHREPGRRSTLRQPQRRRMEDAAGSGIDHAGHDDANPLAGADDAGVGLEQVGDARVPEPSTRRLRFLRRRQADDVRSRLAHRVGEHEERAARPDVDGDARSARAC